MGIPVIINFQNNIVAAQEVSDLISEKGGMSELMQFDVTDKVQVESRLDEWERNHPLTDSSMSPAGFCRR